MFPSLATLPREFQLNKAIQLRLRREDAARLASQRRQEILRDQEDRALLRANPLRYLFHPAFKVRILLFIRASNYLITKSYDVVLLNARIPVLLNRFQE